MVRKKAELKKTIREVINFLSKKINIKIVVLFGSYAKGTPHENSDIDLAVFSKDAKNMSIEEIVKLQAQAKLKYCVDIEIHIFSEDLLKEARPTNFYGHILETGKKVYDSKAA